LQLEREYEFSKIVGELETFSVVHGATNFRLSRAENVCVHSHFKRLTNVILDRLSLH